MTDDLTFEELPPGRYNATVEKVRYSFTAATHIVITYKLDTQHGKVRRLVEKILIGAPPASAPTSTRRRPWDGSKTLANQGPVARRRAGSGWDQRIAGTLEGCAIRVVTRNRRVAGFNCPVVDRIAAPRRPTR